MTKTGLLADPVIRERLKNFISGAMEMRGMKEVPRDQKHSLAVRYWVARKQKTEETVTSIGVGGMYGGYPYMYGGYPPYWGGAWGWCYEEYVVTNYVEGTADRRSARSRRTSSCSGGRICGRRSRIG